MPLLDHFLPPASARGQGESFHINWATAIADSLNQDLLPKGYFAEELVHPVSRTGLAETVSSDKWPSNNSDGNAQHYSPTFPSWTIPNKNVQAAEVRVRNEGGPDVVAAVLINSSWTRSTALAVTCANYLYHSAGLIVVDVIGHLHADLVELLGLGPAYILPGTKHAVAYHPVSWDGYDQVEIWTDTLAVGKPLPELPLWLSPRLAVPINLDSTYTSVCRRRKLLET